MKQFTYLDNAATTFPKPETVYAVMDEVNRNYAVNAGRGAYRKAQYVSGMIAETKEKLKNLVGADKDASVVFCPSVTVALNQIINGLGLRDNSYVYYSPYEHNAVARTLYYLAKRKNIHLKEIPMDDATGEIEIDKLPYIFCKAAPAAVFCTHISNVTGYILPVDEIFRESKRYGSVNVLDMAQSLGLIEYDVRKNKGTDIIAFAGHKSLYGPFGVGGFINAAHIPLNDFIVGGTGSDSLNLEMPKGNEARYESASSNVVAIAGLKAALDVLDVKKIYEHEKMLTEYLLEKLLTMPHIKVFSPNDKDRHVGIISFVVDGYKSDDVGMILDEDYDIAVRTGYHCAPHIHSHLKDEKFLGTVRVGLSQFTSKEELDRLIDALKELE